MTIAIVDYGVGNLFSIYNALNHVGGSPELVDDPQKILDADGVVVPGVGSFGKCMQRLAPFETSILELLEEDVPLLGICVGMQLLFQKSEESPDEGLGWIEGEVVRLPKNVLVPQMGWNSISLKKDLSIFDDISEGDRFYFVHSYHCVPKDPSVTAATTDYGLELSACISRGNLFAVQFHPEKSGPKGLTILKNFVRSTKC